MMRRARGEHAPHELSRSPERVKGVYAAAAMSVNENAYDEWLGAQRTAAELIRDSSLARGALDRAEATRYLTRLATTALWMFVEHADPRWPALYVNTDEHKKFGVDNPDNVYLRSALSGSETYRLWGTRGEAPYIGFTIGADFYGGSGGRQGTLAQHHIDEFEVAPDGTFEIFLGPNAGKGNWIRLEPEASGVIVRQTFFDRTRQKAATLSIERLGTRGTPPPLSPAIIDARLRRAAAFLAGSARLFADMSAGWAKRPNRLHGHAGKSVLHLHGDPDIYYASGHWRLAADEALVIDVPPARRFVYWGFQLANVWLESLDYRYASVATNNGRAVRRDDGTWRIVVAPDDPGVPNWLTTTGHAHGAMCFRWLLAEDDPPLPQVRVVKRNEVIGLP